MKFSLLTSFQVLLENVKAGERISFKLRCALHGNNLLNYVANC